MTENQHLEKMISTRIEVANIDSIDKLARGLGITRSAWIRQAILAELVMELTTLKEESEPVRVPDLGAAPERFVVLDDARSIVPPDLSLVTDLAPVYGLEREHHIDCIKSIDHEGDCLD